jgi:AAA domain
LKEQSSSQPFDRPVPLEQHPLLLRETIYRTTSLVRAVRLACFALDNRNGGLLVVGEAGCGKSFAASYIEQHLAGRLPGLRALVVNSHTNEGKSARNFYSLLVGDPSVVASKPVKAKIDVTARLVDRGRTSSNVVVAVIDEVEALAVTDLLFLRDILNDLERKGVFLLTIMFGESPAAEEFASMVREQLPLGVSDRFLWRKLELKSPSSIEELQNILNQLDETEDFPGWTATRFFLPIAYDAGFRLAPHAKSVAAAYSANVLDVYKPYNTRQLFSGLRCALRAFSPRDAASFSLSDGDWESVFATAVRGIDDKDANDDGGDFPRVQGLPS